MKILVTGGTGYIGSHTCIELLNNGYELIILDNLSNSTIDVVDKIKQITNKEFKFYKCDLVNKNEIENIFNENQIDAVIHFAGLKAVGESVKMPIKYYYNNIVGILNLLKVMEIHNCKTIIFSSSATVYGQPSSVPIKEDFPLNTTNPYGETKLISETILSDIYKSDNEWSIMLLRYFNPIGSHESGMIGEITKGIPNNLMPYIIQVALGKRGELKIFGNEYNTCDGTGVRDYIHVIDLAEGHIKALDKAIKFKGIRTYNLGTGNGYSVLELVRIFEKVTGIKIKYKIDDRREGDIDSCYADPSKALKELGWRAERNIEDMCRSAWNFANKYNINEEGNTKVSYEK